MTTPTLVLIPWYPVPATGGLREMMRPSRFLILIFPLIFCVRLLPRKNCSALKSERLVLLLFPKSTSFRMTGAFKP